MLHLTFGVSHSLCFHMAYAKFPANQYLQIMDLLVLALMCFLKHG